ncbi:MAG: type I 3-dehydroquinate dehydratase [Chloroflexota bacterium]
MICTSLGKIEFNRCMKLLPSLGLTEIRLDLSDFTNEEIETVFKSHGELIATYRASGLLDSVISADKLCIALNAGAKYVDVDISLPWDVTDKIINHAREKGVKVIVSTHKFDKTPEQEEIIELVKGIDALFSPDIIKVACKANSQADFLTIHSLYRDLTNRNYDLIAFTLGQSSTISRLTALFLGAPFVYAYRAGEAPTADEQPDDVTLREIFERTLKFSKPFAG